MRFGDQLDGQIIRGSESWTYFSVVLGIVAGTEIGIVGMTPLAFPWNVLTLIVLVVATVWFFIETEWLHDKLIALKTRYENKAR